VIAGHDITVVIPTHRRDEFLGEAIASVVAQVREPAALIVSDDTGSSLTRAVVERWAPLAPFPVRYVDSSGSGAGTAGASRNAGASLATTSILAFLDDDDTWHPEFLASVTGVLTDDDVDFVVAWTTADEEGYRINRIGPGLAAAEVVARNPGFVGSNFVILTESFWSVDGFDPTLTVSNDKDFLVRALQAGMRYSVVDEVLVRNRIHATGQLTDKTERRAAGIERYMVKHAELLSARDRRELRAQIASVRRVTAPRAALRLGYLARLVYLRSLSMVGRSSL